MYLGTGPTPHGKDIGYAIGSFWEFTMKEREFPCPKCGSKNAENYDPNPFRLMRVYCRDCGWYGCRDGSEDDKWGPTIKAFIEAIDEGRL